MERISQEAQSRRLALKHRGRSSTSQYSSTAGSRMIRPKLLLCLSVALVILVGRAGFVQASPSGQIPLGELLFTDGTINLSQGLSGSIDPSGFRMTHAPDGAPMFVSGDGVWHSLGTGDANGVGGLPYAASVLAMAVFDSELYVGGGFREAGGQPANFIARWDGSSWNRLTDQPNDMVLSMAVIGSDLYVGGVFTRIGDLQVNRIARWDGVDWHRLGTEDANGVGISSMAQVIALAADGDDLYVGGVFHEVAGEARFGSGTEAFNIARWDGANWHGLDAPEANNRVQAVAVLGSDVFVGGWFENMGGQRVNNIARWDGSEWHSLGSGVESNEGLSFDVTSLAVIGSDLFVGGEFQRAGGLPANGIARWDGSDWHVLDAGAQRNVRSLAVSGTDLYVGRLRVVSRWDGSAWHMLGPDRILGNAYALALTIWDSELYVGGNFTEAGGETANGIARWSGMAVSIGSDVERPSGFRMSAAYPNPFETTISIQFALGIPAPVRLEVFDLLGRRVDVVMEDALHASGTYEVSWKPQGLASGTYLIRLTGGPHRESVQVVLIR